MWPQQAAKDPFPGMHHHNYISARHSNSPHSSAFQPKAIQHVGLSDPNNENRPLSELVSRSSTDCRYLEPHSNHYKEIPRKD